LEAGGSPPFTIAAAPCFAECLPISLGQYQSAEKLRRECFSGGKVLKAPANVVVLIVTAALLPANMIQVVRVTPGQRVSAISNDAGTFSLSITELTD
jgi:hypothetical protein